MRVVVNIIDPNLEIAESKETWLETKESKIWLGNLITRMLHEGKCVEVYPKDKAEVYESE